MGNCKSYHPVYQKCKACYGGWKHPDRDKKSDCKNISGPAGSGLHRGSCDTYTSMLSAGSYDVQYEQWLKDNPKPVEPIFAQFPPINAGDFVCTQCTQCQDFSQIKATELLVENPEQVMTCIGKMESALETRTRDAELAADIAASEEETNQMLKDKRESNDNSEMSPNMIYFSLFIIFMVVIAVIIALRRRSQLRPQLRPQQPQQPQYMQPQYVQQPQYMQPQQPQYFQR